MCLCRDATSHYSIGLYWMLCNMSEIDKLSYCGPLAQENCVFGTLSHYVLFSRVYLQKQNLYIFLPTVAIKRLALVIHIYVVTASILGKLSWLNFYDFASLRINSEIDWYIKQATTASFSSFVFSSFLLVRVDGWNVRTNVSEHAFLPFAVKFKTKCKNCFLWEIKVKFWHL
jgi:hypothetical protein